MYEEKNIAVVAASLVLMFAGTTAANAGGYLRLYEHNDFRNEFMNRSIKGKWNMTKPNNDKMSSWINDTDWDGAWYEHAKQKGACHIMASKKSQGFLFTWENDTASSIKLGSGC